MDNLDLKSGQPVRNLQNFLRVISYHYNTVSAVVPDGIYSDQTYQSVKSFQKTFGLPETGVVNQQTWEKIISVYENIEKFYGPPTQISLIPNAEMKICTEEKNELLYAIQSLILCLAHKFRNVPSVDICGVNNEECVNSIKKIQEICGLPQNGEINKQTYDMIAAIYRMFMLESGKVIEIDASVHN